MRILFGLVLAAAIAWGGWWFVASRAAEAALTNWLEARSEAGETGWRVHHEGIALAGFPNRIDFQISRPRIEWPGHGVSWSAPFLQIFALSYRPHHQIIVWPGEQLLTVAGEQLSVSTDDMRASITFIPKASPELDRGAMVAKSPRVESARGLRAAAGTLRLATRPGAARPLARDLALEVTDLSVSAPAMPMPSPSGTLHVEMTATLDRPLDGAALAGAPPRVRAIDITSAYLRWGPLRLDASGQVERDATGGLVGEVALSSDNWPAALALLGATGIMAGRDLALLKSLTESDPTLMFDIRGGALWLGPLRLATLP
jgi:hypothetical protein